MIRRLGSFMLDSTPAESVAPVTAPGSTPRMSMPYDATTKELLRRFPGPWLAYLGLAPSGPIPVVDTELSTVTAEVDWVYRVGGRRPHLIHIENQARRDPNLPARLWRYNAL